MGFSHAEHYHINITAVLYLEIVAQDLIYHLTQSGICFLIILFKQKIPLNVRSFEGSSFALKDILIFPSMPPTLSLSSSLPVRRI